VTAARVAADNVRHGWTATVNVLPDLRGRHVPTTSPSTSTAPGRPSTGHSSFARAASGTSVARSFAWRNRSNGPSRRVARTSADSSASASAARSDRASPSTVTSTTSSGQRAFTSFTGASR